MTNKTEIHYNPVQLKINALKPRELIVIAGRGTGKTQGILAPRIAECVVNMPTSTNGIISSTYKNFKTFVLGSLVSGWKALGFREYRKEFGGHFTFGRNDKFPMPDAKVDDWGNIIHWYNGSICSLISQDRAGIGAGVSMQSLSGDEAYQLKEQPLKDFVFPTMRGLLPYKNSIYYKRKTFTSSMPNTPDGYWLFKYDNYNDSDLINYMYELYFKIQENNAKIEDETYSNKYKLQLSQENETLMNILNKIRRHCTLYLEADSYENFHILGDSFFRDLKRDLPQHLFDSQVLNLRPKGIELGKRFYGRLDERHFYTQYDYQYLDKHHIIMPEDDTCLGDLDCSRNMPLKISMDYGGKINSLIVCQDKPRLDAFYVLKEFFSEQINKEHIEHVMTKFCDYYKPMTNRDIDFYDDVMGNKPMANSAETLRQTAVRILQDNGWYVNVKPSTFNPTHKDKWGLINLALAERDIRLPKIRINESNCPNLKVALFSTPIRNVMGKLEKVKDSERNDQIDQKQATHITDAFDYIYYNMHNNPMVELAGAGDTIL